MKLLSTTGLNRFTGRTKGFAADTESFPGYRTEKSNNGKAADDAYTEF